MAGDILQPRRFSGLTNREVLQRVNDVAEELSRRGLIQSLTSSPTGGYAEHLVARHFGTTALKGKDDGFDLIRPDTGARVQVKARRHGPDGRKSHFGDFGMLDDRRFDEFVGVVFAWNWSIEEAWQMPWKAVHTFARIVNGKHRLYFKAVRDAVIADTHDVKQIELNDED